MENLNLVPLFLLLFVVPLGAMQDSTEQKVISEGNRYFEQSLKSAQTDLDSAIYYMELAYPILKKEEDWEQYVQCFSGLSFFHYNLNEFDSSNRYAELAYNEAQKYLKPDNLMYADIFNNLHAHNSLFGNQRKSIKYQNESLEIRKINNEGDFQLSEGYDNLGTAYSRRGEHKKALEYLLYAIELKIKSDSIPLYDLKFADSYGALANAYKHAEDYTNSIKYYDKSLSILNHEKCQQNQLATKLEVIALVQNAENFIQLDKLDAASSYLDRVFEIHKRGIDIRLPTSLYKRALLHFNKEDLSAALVDIKKANQVAETKSLEITPPLKSLRYKLWGDILLKQKDTNGALKIYKEGLSILNFPSDEGISESVDFASILVQPEALKLMLGKSMCLKSIAESTHTKENWLACFKSYLDAVKLIREIRSGITTSESKNVLANRSMEVYEQALNAAHKVLEFGPGESIVESVFEIIESNKALLLLETYNQHLALGALDVPQNMIDLEYDLKVDMAYYARQKSTEQKKEDVDENILKELDDKFQYKSQQYDSLIHVINKLSPDFNQYRSQIAPVGLSKIKQDLTNTNSTILEYFVGNDFLFLMIIKSEKVEFIKLSNENLLNQIEDLKNELSFEASMSSGNEGFERFKKASKKIYDQLFRPALPFLDSHNPNLIIIPDGYVSSVPFDILIAGENQDAPLSYSTDYLNYLIEDYNISYSYSSTLFSNNLKSEKPNYSKDLIAFAPIFDDQETSKERICECDGIQLQKLDCNLQESETVSGLFSGNLFKDDKADKEAFLSRAKEYKIIHIASHACIDQEDGMLNQIFFTDGGLTNYEIYNSKLNAELTVLSACNTGIGEIQNGEGVLNLAKGFLMAGSKSALMSLWSVNDCTTTSLMEKFYSNLKNGSPRNESMRQAKLEFLKNASKLNAHPYYWGAFVHYGKDNPLQVNSNLSFIIGGLIAGLLLLLIVLFIVRKLKSKSQ